MDQFVAKDVYGYIIITAIALIFVFFGVMILLSERKKKPEERNINQLIIGVCVASTGSFIMLLTILMLATK